jgi:hypothetical protein
MHTIQRPFYPLCGGRLASRLRTLGTGLCDGGVPIGARTRVWDARPLGNRILHFCDEPALAGGNGAARDATRSNRRFRLSRAADRSSPQKACPFPARAGSRVRNTLTSGVGTSRRFGCGARVYLLGGCKRTLVGMVTSDANDPELPKTDDKSKFPDLHAKRPAGHVHPQFTAFRHADQACRPWPAC